MATFERGSRGRCEAVVLHSDTADAVGSGDVPVLATPRLLALLEKASCTAVRAGLGDDQTTVGIRVELDHRAPSPVGARVVAEAEITEFDDRTVTLHVQASDERRTVATGSVRRAVVDRGVFVDRACGRADHDG